MLTMTNTSRRLRRTEKKPGFSTDVIIEGLIMDERFEREFRRQRVTRKLQRGEVLFLEDDPAAFYYIVLSGSIRLYKSDDSLKEVTIYKVSPGQGCMLSAFSIQNGSAYPINAVADKDAVLLCITAEVFRDWITKYDSWRSYVFQLMSRNLTAILYNLETLAFKRIDQQIARLLLASVAPHQRIVHMTHGDIARELGTVREVVSRALKQLERLELIKLFRGRIRIYDYEALAAY